MADLTLRQLLEDMVQRKASDLHITAGVPPELRIDGSITPTEYEVLSPEKCAALAYSVLSDDQRKRFETTKELDFSFGVKGLSRFRANTFLQRGVVSMAIRQIPQMVDIFIVGRKSFAEGFNELLFGAFFSSVETLQFLCDLRFGSKKNSNVMRRPKTN